MKNEELIATLITNMLNMVIDQACVLEKHLERCKSCDKPATVQHIALHIKMCDRCAAETIVKSGRSYVDSYLKDPNDPMNDVKYSLMNEYDWVDSENAIEIRNITNCVQRYKEYEVTPDRIH